MTSFYKKLLVLRVHCQTPQTIVLYLPHMYPDEGVYPCATSIAGPNGPQLLSVLTWAFAPDSFGRKQVLAGHCLDLDNKEQRLQVCPWVMTLIRHNSKP
jgi:hypothetical protein